MVSIPIEFDSFKEKISSVRIADINGHDIATTNYFNRFPTAINLYCDLELFNINPQKEYSLIIFSKYSKDQSVETLLAINVNIDLTSIVQLNNGIGKSSISFDFKWLLSQQGDYKLQFALLEGANVCHQFSRYFSFLEDTNFD
ncbi:hypothetical protein P7J38_03395 [Streptococcus suis]|uniref:hypothetical protein n=1 Tax=Streptococcus suis TaxID=1307 RepID=UPI0038B86C49